MYMYDLEQMPYLQHHFRIEYVCTYLEIYASNPYAWLYNIFIYDTYNTLGTDV